MFFILPYIIIYVRRNIRFFGCKNTNKNLNLQENDRKLRFFSQIFCWFGKK